MQTSPIDRLAAARATLLKRLLPAGVPLLWCPLLTHYTAEGALDTARASRHLAFLQDSVKGYLVPGSTGDGWQLDDAQVRELLEFTLDQARERKFSVLIGVLATRTEDVLRKLEDTMAWLRRRTNATSDEDCLRQSSVCGFTVCPPKGRELTQAQIHDALDRVLATGLPISLYQLPQITENEMSANTVEELARNHANFLLLKDTSGEDRVAAAGFREAFLVRGAEGGYARHLSLGGGAYDGLLLSTANCFGPQYAEMIEHLRQDRTAAQAISDRIERVADEVFAAAAKLPYGNAFTNANKALDHFMAHGPQAREIAGPRLHSGHRLPDELIDPAGNALDRHGLMPARGYLDN
ncbi:dihydrodipicolinate synthase family protein [Methylibium sp.]|uniref:dihydrodipicolinate synthase family protein n=1 Tax=Methylibium sp. TaxID=2067992 RepID=UPI0017D8C435|nr:dihydrodipicolinate synthase family protein [Methylibium sp.]MBA3588570.1 dihydrodipicolinate synthase family protein [Methylibium sp.]